jgi:ribosomal protein S18 acetylase RimI-like enzyme
MGLNSVKDMSVEITPFSINDLDSVADLFYRHGSERFSYVADIQLFKVFSSLSNWKAFLAKISGEIVGCIQALKYMFNNGWIGGLLVDKQYRRLGIGKKLLLKAMDFLGSEYIHVFVEPENIIARSLYEKAGFRLTYRRVDFLPHEELIKGWETISCEVSPKISFNNLSGALGFKERQGVVQLGYYPVKIDSKVFDRLMEMNKILNYGRVIGVIENSYICPSNGYEFHFNDYILDKIPLPRKQRIVEVNPFYMEPNIQDFIRLLQAIYTTTKATIIIRTYEQDPIVKKLESMGKLQLGALIMQFSRES